MARLTMRLLGPLEVTLDGEPVTGFESDKVRALLAYLAVERDRPQRRERLAGLLWPERSESVARTNLRVALANLRTAIDDRQADPPFLCITRQTIQLNPEGDTWVDVAIFGDLVEARSPPSRERAVEVYGGDFLEGFSLAGSAAFEEWLVLTRERLARQAQRALQQVACHHENRGAYQRALVYARRQVALDPWGERGHRRVLRLLARTGQRNAALAHYETLCQTLARDLGVEPEDETAALYRHIRQGDAGKSPVPQPSHNLPAPLTPFVGRRAELAAVAARLRDPACRLLTLVGPSGSGKTRLALETARRLHDEADAFPHGLYFIELAPLQSAADVAVAVAEALAFPLGREQPPEKQVIDYLGPRRLLLLLDNVEHLLPPAPAGDEVVDWLVDLLQAAPGVRVLTTSRARLNLQAEYLFPVAGLALPESGIAPEDLLTYDAVVLFVDGAVRGRPDFDLTAANAADVLRICRIVEGLPLAILLAAAWVERLPPAEIARRLAGEQDEGVDLLAAGWRDVPERQRSMRTVFDHSWRLLTESERTALQGLSVFRGSFTRQAAAEIAGATPRDLKSLMHKSLLNRTPAGRYGLHELLRQYAAGYLTGDAAAREAVSDQHGTHYVRALTRWARALKDERQEEALAEMDAEIQNARAAWAWLVERGQVERLADAAEGLCLYFEWRVRYRQGEEVCRQAAESLSGQASLSPAGLRLLVYLLTWQSLFVHYLEGSQEAKPLLDRGLALLDDARLAELDTRAEQAHAWWGRGRLLLSRDRDGARRAYERCLALYQDLGDRWGQANALAALGGVAWNLGDYREARRRHEASLALRQALGDKRGIANSLMAVGVTALYQGQLAEAKQMVREGHLLRQQIGDRRGIADAVRHLGVTHLLSGEFAEATALLKECLAIYTDLGLRFSLEVAMLGDAEVHQGRYRVGRSHAQEALGIAQETGYQRGKGYALLVLGEAALAQGEFVEAWGYLDESMAVYRRIGQWEEWHRALATSILAARNRDLGPGIKSDFLAGLRDAVEGLAALPLVWGLPALALLMAKEGAGAHAVELYALAERQPLVSHSRWFEDVVGRAIAAATASLPRADIRAAQQRGRSGHLVELVKKTLPATAAKGSRSHSEGGQRKPTSESGRWPE